MDRDVEFDNDSLDLYLLALVHYVLHFTRQTVLSWFFLRAAFARGPALALGAEGLKTAKVCGTLIRPHAFKLWQSSRE